MLDIITNHIDIWTSAKMPKANGGRGRSKNGEQTQYGIKKLRELILELAVRGKLVPQDPNDEPASVLLEKITKEKAKLIKAGKIKKQKPFPKIASDEMPFQLPNGWKWIRFQDIASYIQRGKSPKYSDHGRIQVISQKCIQWNIFDISQARFIDDKSADMYQPERFLQKNDLLWNSTGTGTVGRINVLPAAKPNTLVADSHVTVIRPLKVNSNFLWCYIAAPGIQQRIEPEHEKSLVSGTTKQVELNTSAVTLLPVPLPPIEEQHRIVTKVDELMALCDRLEQQQTDSDAAHKTLVETLLGSLTNSANADDFQQTWKLIENNFDTLFITEHSIDQLKQTILQLAVMGKLVPQDPKDEPASALLKKTISEKKRLIKENVIRDVKSPAYPNEPPSYESPSGWVWTNLYEIGEIAPRNDATDTDEASFVPMQSISENYGTSVQHEVKQWGEIKSGFTHFREEDVVLAKITPCFQNGKSTVMRGLTNGFGAGTTELHVYRSINACTIPEYVLIYLKSPRFISDGIPKMTGTAGQKRITRDYFAGNHFPLPPLAEQHRIVSKVDELMALCNTLKNRIKNTQTTQLQLANVMTELT